MKIEEIMELWAGDTTIDIMDLSNAAIKIPKLHSKYYNIIVFEKKVLRQLEAKGVVLEQAANDYYLGELEPEDIAKWGWDGPCLKIYKTTDSRKKAVESDLKVVEHNLRVANQKDKVEFLTSIIYALKDRTFQIKAAIDYERFKVGA